jgi:hypothetical protein
VPVPPCSSSSKPPTVDPTVHGPAPGPPPPPAPIGGPGESRATAATWVAATGALLLLAAAGTFLAVSWEALGLVARVAVVGAATGIAIVGGHRMRRSLPAVGAVIYHLGALLLPIDALGLALQLDVPPSGRWLAVGLVAVVALPPLAVVGGSRTLASAALLGVPVAATGAGLTGLVPAAWAVVAVAGLGLVLARGADGPLVPVRRAVAPTLALLAVHLPLAVQLFASIPGSGGPLADLQAAGWAPSGWVSTLGVGMAAVAVLAVSASWSCSSLVAGLTPLTGGAAVLAALLPPGTPRLALFVVPAVVAVAIELATLATAHDGLWAGPTRRLALATEVVGAVVASQTVVIALATRYGLVAPDPELAVMLAVLAVAWAVAGLRRWLQDGTASAVLPVALGLVAVHLAGALAVAGAPPLLQVVLLLLAAGGTLAWSGWVPAVDLGDGPVGHLAAVVAIVLLSAATAVGFDQDVLLLVLASVPTVVGLHLRAAMAVRRRSEDLLTGLAVPTALALVVAIAWLLSALPGAIASFAGLAGLAAVLAFAWCLDERPAVADAIRLAAALGGLRVLVVGWPAVPLIGASLVGDPGLGEYGWLAIVGLRLLPAALLPAGLVAAWLLLDALRTRRPRIAVLAAPVLIRAVGALALTLGLSPSLTGVVLIASAVGAVWLLLAGPVPIRPAAGAGLAVALPVGWLLVADDPTLRAWVLLAGGLAVVAAGALTRDAVVAHLGGVTAVLGTWQWAAILEVTALDLWLLPVAVHLAVAGLRARRVGSVSSWVAYVPPLLLVAVPAVVERIGGGPGWHSVLAGGLAVAAVLAGGLQRLGGPLIVGTALLVLVVGIETFAVVAAVPTWVWLAVGGSVLLAAAALIERVGGSPVTVARRVVEVVGERFD